MSDCNFMYEYWMKNAIKDPDLIEELHGIKGQEEEISDRFYRSLEFGTGGLRGVIGAGTNRMNVYTVAQATQGLANYLNETCEAPTAAIGYDSRIKSELFAKTAAGVLAANGIRVFFFPELMPTPMLSYAVRRLHCSSGIVITASHNPSKYNGYKCYDAHGYQMTDEAAKRTYEYIQNVNMFTDVKSMDFEDALAEDMIDYIEDWLIEDFYKDVLSRQIEPGVCKKADLKVIYSPLNGTGNKPVKTILKKIGVKDLRIVLSQEKPDGSFPSCPFPNPEIQQVFEEGMKMTEEFPADLMIATDPDCDRVGIAVRHNGEYKLMTGNEVGCMLTEYILSRKKAAGELCEKPIIVKTIVTSELIRAIGEEYDCEIYDLLTGFKYIGELIEQLAEKQDENRFELGMEESYGYLSGTHVREKDAVNGAMIIAEMAAYYKTLGKTLVDVMESLYEKHGMYLNTLLNFGFEGADGMKRMADMMTELRTAPPKEIGGMELVRIADYLTGVSTDIATGEKTDTLLPSSNVISFSLADDNKVIVRPSGTEPKIKIYITSHADTRENAQKQTDIFAESIKSILGIKE